jgi:hypothetical protein
VPQPDRTESIILSQLKFNPEGGQEGSQTVGRTASQTPNDLDEMGKFIQRTVPD